MYALGIDIGTTYTAAATWRDGRAEIFSLGDKSAAIPSVVLVRDDRILVGDAALRRGLSEPQRLAREFKRRLGDTVPLLLGGSPYSPQALAAELLRAVVEQVNLREGAAPARICLTHPANWGQFKRDMMHQVVRLSGLTLPYDFTTEPEAAAAFYAHEQRVEDGAVVAVYDLGGGTFDATVLRKKRAGFEILGKPEGIEQLGGIDVDAAVFDHVTRSLGEKFTDLDEDDPATVAPVARLRQECVAAKEALSADTDVAIPVLLPTGSTEVRLTRAELEGMVRPMLYGTIEALRRALESATVTPADLHSVLLVGGSSRIPLVAQLIGAELGRPVAVDAHPKHAVAIGAARLAGAVLAPERTQRVQAPQRRHPSPPQVKPPVKAPPAAKQPVRSQPPERRQPAKTQVMTAPPQPTSGPLPILPAAPPPRRAMQAQPRPRPKSRGPKAPVLAAVAVVVFAVIGVSLWLIGDREGWWTTAAGGSETTTTPPATEETRPTTETTQELSAADQLSQRIDEDRPEVEQLFGRWVPQLSAKNDGMVVDGETYDLDAVLANHLDLRNAHPESRLLWSGDYPVFRFDGFYVTVVALPFDTAAEANTWCDEREFPVDECFAKFINDTGSWQNAAVYRN